ncbi:TPA: transferrin-binding protein-like solute binding protein [Neisseria meningitidis]|nr:transferrin-binding protein-like solute binding protein [Neisseria meningitidis]
MCKPNYGGIVLLPLLLASCIGGNFGVQPVVESTPTAYPVTFKSKDVPTPPPAGPSVETTPVNQPAVGAAMRLPRRNIAFYNKDGTEIPDKHQAEEHLLLKEEDILFLDGTSEEQVGKLKNEIHKRNPDVRVITSENENKKYNYNYQFVRAGYVFTKAEGKDNEKEKTSDGKEFVNRFSYDGFVYYSGEHPSQSLPRTETVQYSGNWQFVTDAKRWRTQNAGGGRDLGFDYFYGNDIGATSYAARDADDRGKHPAEYTVNFDNKTLNGKLIKNQYVRDRNGPKNPLIIYNITAKLDGNRFTGSAEVNPDLAEKHAGKEHLFFHTNADQRLEGGFFGDNGEELAGRFISNDKSVFGVFAGKQKTEAANAADTKPALPSGKHTKILDSLKISVDEAADKKARPFEVSSMPDFGHPDKLLVEGREISLLKDTQTIVLADGREMTVRACCDFLTYVKLGRIKTDRPASKPKAEDKGENEEGAGVDSVEEGEDEIDDEDEVSEEDAEEIEEEAEEEEAEADEADEPEEAEETKEKSPTEEGNGGSGSILPALEAPKGRDIDLFLKGIRTAEADIPQTGKAHYIGTWEARIGVSDKKDNPLDSGTFIQKDNYANQGAKAQFTVDFGAKSLSGKLTEKNDTHPAFYIEKGVIDGNGFHALARTRENGVDLSGQGSTNPQSFKASNLLVEGGFYGPQAAELGGNIIDSDRKIGVVFGAKKDMQEVEK